MHRSGAAALRKSNVQSDNGTRKTLTAMGDFTWRAIAHRIRAPRVAGEHNSEFSVK